MSGTDDTRLCESLRTYANQVPTVLSVENLRRTLVKAAERIEALERELAEARP